MNTIELDNETINTILNLQYKVCAKFAPFTTRLIDTTLQTGTAPDQEAIDRAEHMDGTWRILVDACQGMTPEEVEETLKGVKESMAKMRGGSNGNGHHEFKEGGLN